MKQINLILERCYNPLPHGGMSLQHNAILPACICPSAQCLFNTTPSSLPVYALLLNVSSTQRYPPCLYMPFCSVSLQHSALLPACICPSAQCLLTQRYPPCLYMPFYSVSLQPTAILPVCLCPSVQSLFNTTLSSLPVYAFLINVSSTQRYPPCLYMPF